MSYRHKRQSSDFGQFVSSAPSTTEPSTRPSLHNNLDSSDLLGSFDGEQDLREHSRFLSGSPSSSSKPIHIQLPPRPDEITPDYIPPKRFPRRMSQQYMNPGPSSPPSVNSAGHEIVFYPDTHAGQTRSATHPGPSHTQARAESSHPSGLLGTLTSTARAAGKWRRSLDQSRTQGQPSEALDWDDPQTVDITHDNPFITPEQLAGSYIPPSGAPGYQEVKIVAAPHKLEIVAQLSLNGRRPTTTPVLDVPTALSLQRHLPARQRLSKTWSLVFSLEQHGASLASLYRHAETSARSNPLFGTLLIIEDAEGHRFGAFLNEPLSRRDGAYFGSGEAFLYKLGPTGTPAVFRWTGKNQYFALCETSSMSFGGGSGAYGLILDATFSKSSSATCPTFDNEVLCVTETVHADKATYFECIGLEVWATTTT